MKKRDAVILISLFLAVVLFVTSLSIYYWYRRHKLLFDVNSITAYESIDNENIVRFEIKGTAKTWFFDFKEYNNVYLLGEECGGETRYFNTAAKSDVMNISHKKSDFTIIVDIDKTSYNWGDSVEEYIYLERFCLMDADDSKDYSSLDWVMFMDDYTDVKVIWEEPRKIDDILLEIENWREYMELQGEEYYLTDSLY